MALSDFKKNTNSTAYERIKARAAAMSDGGITKPNADKDDKTVTAYERIKARAAVAENNRQKNSEDTRRVQAVEDIWDRGSKSSVTVAPKTPYREILTGSERRDKGQILSGDALKLQDLLMRKNLLETEYKATAPRNYESSAVEKASRATKHANAKKELDAVTAELEAMGAYGADWNYLFRSILGGAASTTEGLINEAGYLGKYAMEGEASRNESYLKGLAAAASILGMDELAKKIEAAAGDQETIRKETAARELAPTVDFATRYNTRTAEKYTALNNADRLIGTTAQGVGGMLPAMAANVIAPGAALPVMGLGAAGNATTEAKAAGAADANAMLYGTAVGTVEAMTEAMFGGAGKLMGKGFVSTGIGNAASKLLANNEPAQLALKSVFDVLGEGGEEFIAELADKGLNDLLIGSDQRTWGETLSDAQYSAMVGMLVSGVMKSADLITPNTTPKQAADIVAKNIRDTVKAQQTAHKAEQTAPTAQIAPVAQKNAAQPPTNSSAKPIAPMPATAQGEKNAPVEGAESTAVNTDPAGHTPAEQKIIEEYQSAVDEGLKGFINKWRGLVNPDYKKRVKTPVAKVSDRATKDIAQITGIDTTGFDHVISGNALQHIERRHGPDGQHDHSMADDNDIARIGYVLTEYDAVAPLLDSKGNQKYSTELLDGSGKPAPLVAFGKKINGNYYVIEAVPDTNAKAIQVVSAYISNKSIDQLLNIPQSDPQPTPKTPNGANAPVAPTVSQNGTGVKPIAPPVERKTERKIAPSVERKAATTNKPIAPLPAYEEDRVSSLSDADAPKARKRDIAPPVTEIADEATFPDEVTDWITSPPEKRTSQEDVERLKQTDLDEYFQLIREGAEVTEPTRDPNDLISTEDREAQKPLRQQAREGWSWFKRKMVDSGEAVSRIGKAVKDKSLYSYYNMARASSNAAISMIENRRTDIYGRDTGAGLNETLSNVRSKGDEYYKNFQSYLFHMHNIDRMSRHSEANTEAAQQAYSEYTQQHPELMRYTDEQKKKIAQNETHPLYFEAGDWLMLYNAVNRAENVQNAPVFGEEVTAEVSTDEAAKLLRENPEFREEAQKVYDYIDNLLRYRVDSGLIDQSTYDMLKSIYPHYVPTYRSTTKENADQRRRGKVQIGKTIQRATGGDQTLLPLHKSLAQQTMSVVREGSKNRFGMRLLDSGAQKNAPEHVRSIQEYTNPADDNPFEIEVPDIYRKNNTFIVREGSKLWEIEVSPALFEAVQALSPEPTERNTATKVLRKGNDIYKRLITGYNPTFLVRNFARDLQDAGLYSSDPAGFAKNYPLAVAEIKNDGKYWQQYKALGGTYSTFFDYETGDIQTHSKARQKTIDRIEALNMGVEQAPRLAEFMTVVKAAEKKGEVTMDTLMDAMYKAADITTNFGRSGTAGKWLNANLIPFFNPSVQGFSKMTRTLTEAEGIKDWGGLMIKATALGIAPALLNALLYSDDEEWDEINDRDKDTNYLFKIGEGRWIKIPRGRVLSLLAGTTNRVIDMAKGEEADWGEFLNTAATQVAPTNPLEENILKAWFDADLLDRDSPGETWYGSDIENQRLQSYAPGQRYDEKTDVFSKWLGDKLNLSPKKINYLLDQYTGVVGDTVLPILTPTAERNLFSKAFTLDTASSNKLSTQFYELADELTYAKNDPNADGVDEALAKFWNKQSSAISEVNAAIRKIEADESLSSKDKRELARAQYAIRNGLMRNALDMYDAYSEAVEKYYDGSGMTDPDERTAEAYRKANREIIGAEYALSAYSKDVYEAAQDLQQTKGLSYEDFYESYFGNKQAPEFLGYYKETDDGWQKMSDSQATKYELIEEAEAEGKYYATNGAVYYRKNDEGEWVSIDRDARQRQRKVTKELGITAEEYWSKPAEYRYAYENPESYAVAQTVGGYDDYKEYSSDLSDIKADKDPVTGKSISNSRRKKVFSYIDGLSVDAGTKAILKKLEYPSYGVEDGRIENYLDELLDDGDITPEQYAMTVKKLGGKIRADGSISW